SWGFGSAPIRRFTNAFLHAAKATNPRAADASTVSVPSIFKRAIDQPVTFAPPGRFVWSAHRGAFSRPGRSDLNAFHCKFRDLSERRFSSKTRATTRRALTN